MEKSIAICAATPFQMLNAINLAYNHLGSNYYKVLFYRNYSETTNLIVNKIRTYDLFDEIIEYNLVDKNKGFIYYLNDLEQATMPRRFIENLSSSGVILSEYDFDYITVTSGTEVEVALTRVFPNARTIAYDDGLGSYVGDIVHDHKLHWIWRMLGRRTDKIWPEVMYVNNASFCDTRLSDNIKQLKSLDKSNTEYREMINDVFTYSADHLYSKHRIVYLTQPLDEIDKSLSEQVKETEKELELFKQDCVIRMHPRAKMNLEEFMETDSTNNLWELVCANDISAEHILIGMCSSAQLMPKILYNKEPWVIFTFNQYQYCDESIVDSRFAPIARKLKVIIPSNRRELFEVISAILKNEK